MRIHGLVSFFNHVRSQLQTGLAPNEVEPFRNQVIRTVREVGVLCRRHGGGIESLPAPTRRAYEFLRDLDLDHLPLREAGAPAALKPGFRVKNVVKTGEFFADRIWRELDPLLTVPGESAKLAGELARQAAAIEGICEEHGRTSAVLEAPSRSVFCWLMFLAGEDQLRAHLEALARAREIARRQPEKKPVLIHLVHQNHLWRRRDYRNVVVLRVHLAYQHADEAVWESLLRCMLGSCTPESDRPFKEFAESEDFSEVIFELESFAVPPAPPSRGRAHDLEESFARVNAAYFGGRMPKPRLVWNRTLTTHKFAHYQSGPDIVMMSVTLDDPALPAGAFDFVMYHELLHKKHGTTFVNGRRLSHTPAFRADERRYAGWEAAEQQIHALALRQQRNAPV
jgi:hypothetical protein